MNKKQPPPKKTLKPPRKVKARDFRAELAKPNQKIAVKFNRFRAGPRGAAKGPRLRGEGNSAVCEGKKSKKRVKKVK